MLPSIAWQLGWGSCVLSGAYSHYCAAWLQIVAVGLCNHKAVCARCCLRMRLKYKDMNCPLCKQDQVQVGSLVLPALAASTLAPRSLLQHSLLHQPPGMSQLFYTWPPIACQANVSCMLQVIMTAWKGKGVPDWEQLQSKAEAMWQKPSWAKGVLVDSASCAPGSQELFRRVQVTSGPVQGFCVTPCCVMRSIVSIRHVLHAHYVY